MARAKPRWRRILNARFLRWWLAALAVRTFPWLGRRLAFFPDAIDMVAGADRVLADERIGVPAETFAPHMEFLSLCQARDSHDASVRLPNGVVTGRRTALYDHAWIDAGTSSVLLPELRRTVLVRGEQVNWNAASARFGRPRVDISGRVFAPLETRNYFHVLLENGVRLLDLLDSGLVADAPLTVITGPDGTSVERAMYQGIAAFHPGTRLQAVPRGALVRPGQAVIHFPCDNYWEWPPVDRRAANRLVEAFEQVYGVTDAVADADLYLSRRGARLRTALNEDALDDALSAAGFNTFVATDTNHPEQIARFRAARRVVSIHGAGLTNMVFCRPGTLVVEIFPANFVKSPYWRLAQSLGLRYRPVIVGPGDYHQRFDVDVDAVIAALEGD